MTEPYLWVIKQRDPKDKKWKPVKLLGLFFTRRLARAALNRSAWFFQPRTLRICKYWYHTMEEKHKW